MIPLLSIVLLSNFTPQTIANVQRLDRNQKQMEQFRAERKAQSSEDKETAARWKNDAQKQKQIETENQLLERISDQLELYSSTENQVEKKEILDHVKSLNAEYKELRKQRESNEKEKKK